MQRATSTRHHCGTCRHYFPAPGRDQGWCRHPRFRGRDGRTLVRKIDHRCFRLFSDLWEPLPTTREIGRGDAGTTRLAGAVRRRDATGPASVAVRRPVRPAALPARWARAALLAALAGVGALAVRLATLGDPLPTPIPILEPATQATVAPATAGAAVPAVATVVTRTTSTVGTATPTPRLGTYARILAGGAAGLPLLAQPGGSPAGARALPAGTILEVVGDPVEVNGARWRRLRDGDGRLGWLAEAQLAILQPALGETTSELGLMAEPRRAATRLATRIPAGVPVAIIDAREGEAVEAGPTPTRWYWVRVITTGEVGWAHSGTIKRRG